MNRMRLFAALAIATVGGATAVAASSCSAARMRQRSESVLVTDAGTSGSRPLATGQGGTATGGKREVLRLDFEYAPLGPFTEKLLRAEAPEAHSVSSHLAERSHVVRDGDGNKALRIDYPARSVGPAEGGAVFIVKIPPADEYYLSYRVRFDAGFEFVKGGKLPGLSSGGGKYTGGRVPVDGDGWSARLVWKAAGNAGVYFYHVGMEGPWGDTLHLTGAFQPARWHTIVQRVRLNHGDEADGILEVWMDGGLSLTRHDLKFRLGDKGQIDSLCFSTFHGGNNPSFAPSKGGYATFDDFVISHLPFGLSAGLGSDLNEASPPPLSQAAATGSEP
jgi:hypothetical protein